ncbi:MAG: hypothetical protein ACLTDV_04820 [Eubacterium sp.]
MIPCLTIPENWMGHLPKISQTIRKWCDCIIVCLGSFYPVVFVAELPWCARRIRKANTIFTYFPYRYVVLIILLALIFSRFFGAAGVWHAFWVTEALSAVFAVIIYRRSVKAESFIEAE